MAKPKFWWFQGESVRELTRQLTAAGPEARLEVHPEGKDALRLFVVPPEVTATEGGGGINDSHPCPPQCP